MKARAIIFVKQALSLAVLCLAFACGSARRSEPIKGPLNVADPQVQRGEVVFNRYCDKCHPGGETGLGPAINNKPAPGFVVRMQIRKGLGAMPAFKKEAISEDEMDDLIKYIKTLRRHK